MPPSIPTSLSPHICTICSPDLEDTLKAASLPLLPQVLQSFSPLPQVTTRTTSLVSVPHTSFALRFSDLRDVEEACREAEDQRAVRTVDWMTARINNRCAKWVEDLERVGDRDAVRTPWWDELRRCAEGDFVPSKTEGWNHPAALILAVSTTAPNPLQAITTLHSRAQQLPSWVDTNVLRYTLIIHPSHSPLSAEEAGALYNAVKKQFGLHSYLLSLNLPKNPPPVPVPAPLPRLPPPPSPDSPPRQYPLTPVVNGFAAPGDSLPPTILNTLAMEEKDIQQTARFTREFVVMSLVPWMEKCVVEWNENFSSTRRLPSRLFSSTRRLFGSPSPSPAPSPASSSAGSLPIRSSSIPTVNGPIPPPSQQRRLAEFATILGDYKLAITVWEALRKESKGGSDILPLLLSPSPTIPLHAHAALTGIHPQMLDLPPHLQLRALLCAVRWEAGIAIQDFLSSALEGERWLVWAASNSEIYQGRRGTISIATSPSSALKRKEAVMEKSGALRPLTMYFLRKAQELYHVRPPKELSPSFWDSEGKSSTDAQGLEDILSGIEHPLGRLLYTTGDVAGAVRLFLGLLRGTPPFLSFNAMLDDAQKLPSNDKLYLDDFRVAYSYWKSTEPAIVSSTNLEVPVKFCIAKQSRLRHSEDGADSDADVWATRQEDWKTFWRSQGGKESVVPAGKVSTDELFWVDLALRNPLDADINLTNVTLLVRQTGDKDDVSQLDFVEVEVIDEVSLGPRESITVSISLKCNRPAKLSITHATYDFLSMLPTKESLFTRGRRLRDTPQQRRTPTYAPDVLMQVEVVPSDHRLTVNFVDDGRLVLLQGENKTTRLWLTNAGSSPISEMWMVVGPDDEVLLGGEDELLECTTETEVFQSSNSLKPQPPLRIPLEGLDSETLQPGQSIEVPIIFHAESTGSHELYLLFVYREAEAQPFYSTKLARSYEVTPVFEISSSAVPSQSQDYAYAVDIDITNASSTVFINIVDIVCDPKKLSVRRAAVMNFIRSGRRKYSSRHIAEAHSYIPASSHSSIFPMYNPAALDFVVFWEIPSQGISGHISINGIHLGAGHGALDDIVEQAEGAKTKRNMYAETQRENVQILDAIRSSEWNAEMNPIVLFIKDTDTQYHDFSSGYQAVSRICRVLVAESFANTASKIRSPTATKGATIHRLPLSALSGTTDLPRNHRTLANCYSPSQALDHAAGIV
ncbi:unnamed protein product [Cyclocybe aegerita]|uniref:Uncharacterized protein n=1 Tax=Cyclocybe aegerita TaxID=1973307 RepID=A0A8S0WKY5_CYCAE|nr:unnamed protein product [Cyclocybe aegerita]